jgi:guanine nucleotide-binding protein G(i) subunit alpha
LQQQHCNNNTANTTKQEVADDITALWADPGVRACYEKRDMYWLLDAAAYYFSEAQRIADPEYAPTEDDVIMTRVRTTGIDSTDFAEPPRSYRYLEVNTVILCC